MKHAFHVHKLSKRHYTRTVVWSVTLCIAIVIAAAMLGRATHNFDAALVSKPDVAIYLLLPDEDLGATSLLREEDGKRTYLAETKDGQKVITLMKNENHEWYVAEMEDMHE